MRISVPTSIRQRPLLVLLAMALLIVECLARRTGAPPPSLAVVRNPFASIAVATVLFRYLIYDTRDRSRKWIIYLIPTTFAAALGLEGSDAQMSLLFMDTLCAVGALGVVGFVVAAVLASDTRERGRYLGQLMDALVLPMAASMASFGLWSTGRINPVYDSRVYAFEEILGVQVSAFAVRTYPLLGPLSAIASGCYVLLAMAVVLVAAGQKEPGRERDVLTATVAAGACGFALYFVCPVVGTHEAFGQLFPNALPHVPANASLITSRLGAPRNGMPSLHTVWALLILFNAQTLRTAARRGFQAFVAMTIWATVGPDGSHWLMDVVVGVPFAVAIQSVFVTRGLEDVRHRWIDATSCAALTALWLIGFRAPVVLVRWPAAVAWLAVAATVCWPLSRQLGRHLVRADHVLEVRGTQSLIDRAPA